MDYILFILFFFYFYFYFLLLLIRTSLQFFFLSLNLHLPTTLMIHFRPPSLLRGTLLHARAFSISCNAQLADMKSGFQVFNKTTKLQQRQRAAKNVTESRQVEYLRDEVALRMIERLAFISREFPRVLDFGSGAGNLEKMLCENDTPDRELVQSRLKHITMFDSCKEMLYRDSNPDEFIFNSTLDIDRVVGDEESFVLANGSRLQSNSFDAVLSNMSMHWINDLPGVLSRIQDVLVPDGMFMASMLGGDTLFELRTSLQLAELERQGGVSPRVSPLADVKDMGALMQKAKYNLLTVDVDDIIVSYPDIFTLINDIQAMGESNSVLSRQPFIHRDVLLAAEAIYRSLHGNDDGSIPATFRIIYLIGWKPSENQPKPLKRGVGQVNLKDALGKTPEELEISLKDK